MHSSDPTVRCVKFALHWVRSLAYQAIVSTVSGRWHVGYETWVLCAKHVFYHWATLLPLKASAASTITHHMVYKTGMLHLFVSVFPIRPMCLLLRLCLKNEMLFLFLCTARASPGHLNQEIIGSWNLSIKLPDRAWLSSVNVRDW